MNRSEIEQALVNSEFFKRLDENEISEIANLCQEIHFEGGEYVFQQGDYGEHLYVVVQGRINLERSMDLGAHQGSVVI